MDEIRLAERIISEGVWFPPLLLKRLPVLRPYAIRDNACRKPRGKNPTREEAYGWPNSEGFFRSDNTSVNKTRVSFPITGSHHLYHQRKLPNDFIACHAWRKIKDCGTSTLIPSFTLSLVIWFGFHEKSQNILTKREDSVRIF
jgi:hypothetical protein